MASSQQLQTQGFDVCDPASSSPAAVITAVGSIVPITFIHLIQCLGNLTYQVIMKTKQSFQDVVGVGSLMFGEVSVPVNPVGPQLTEVSCLFLPGFITDEAFVQALAPYGKVKALDHDTYKDCPNILTGTCRLKVTMNEQNPMPNFLRVAGHGATFVYRGVRKVSLPCCQKGHFNAQCKEEYSERCSSFGHANASCSACRRCGESHATADSVSRHYSAAWRGIAAELPVSYLAVSTGSVTQLVSTVQEVAPAALSTMASQGVDSTTAPSDDASSSLVTVPDVHTGPPLLQETVPLIHQGLPSAISDPETETYSLHKEGIGDAGASRSPSEDGDSEMMSSREDNVLLEFTSTASLIAGEKTIEDSKRRRSAKEGTHLTDSDQEYHNHPKKLWPSSTAFSKSSEGTLK